MFEGCDEAVAPDSPDAVRIEGIVRDGGGPVAWPECFLEFWQGEQWARARTDAAGRYAVTVRKPEPPRRRAAVRQAPHLNVAVFARGLLKQALTRVYFPDEADANGADPVLELVPEAGPRAARGARRRRRPAIRHRSAGRERDAVLRLLTRFPPEVQLMAQAARVSVFSVGDVFPDIPDGRASFAPLEPLFAGPTSSSATARGSTPTVRAERRATSTSAAARAPTASSSATSASTS